MARPKVKSWYPTNPNKYVGNVNNIKSRSSWETRTFNWMDLNPNVLIWNSEEISIPYLSPIDNKMHRYFPDVLAKMRTKTGDKTFLLEIKPQKECFLPTTKNKKQFLTEMCTFTVNQSKWQAAREFCKKQGFEFIVLTEYDLGIKQRPKQK